MRDYLEEWLSEEESVVTLPDAVSRRGLRRQAAPGEEGEKLSSAGRTSGKQIWDDGARMARTEGQGEETVGAAAARDAAALPTARGALEAALAEGQRRETAQGALYAAVERLGRVERLAEGARQGQAIPLTLPVQPGGAAGVEALDRAVQRDARRYDGGFSLY